MPTTIWTQADLDAAKAALLQAMTGKSVTIGDRSYTSQDLSELRALVANIEQQLASAAGRSLSRLAATRKGV